MINLIIMGKCASAWRIPTNHGVVIQLTKLAFPDWGTRMARRAALVFIEPDRQVALCASAARLSKQLTGHGPEHVHLDVLNGEVALYFKGFLSPLEETLVARTGQCGMVEEVRQCLIGCCRKDWQELFAQFGLKVHDISGELDVVNARCVLRAKVG